MTPLSVPLATPAHLIVLIGGGEFSFGETREIDEFLVRSMPPGNRRIAFVPAASGSAEYAAHLGKYLAGIDSAVEMINVPIYRGRDGRREKNANLLRSAGMIYLGGGVTNNLLDPLRDSQAEIAMREAAERGVVIAAIGAAAACFGTHARDMRDGLSALPALGWLKDTVIESGFQADNDTTLRRLMSLPGTKLGLGIPQQTAVVIKSDGTTDILGPGKIAAFRKSG